MLHYIAVDRSLGAQGIYVPSPTLIDEPGGVRRESVRPARLRGANFDEEYDDETLFYDATWSPGGDHIILIAPPFRNLLPAITNMEVTARPSDRQLSFTIKSLDRHAQAWIKAPAGTERLTIRTSFGEFNIQVGENLSHVFRDKRVVLTKSKNNLIEWIQDWARFYRDVQNANAILLYDNNSTRYDLADLRSSLTALSGFDEIVIVKWPFKFGPQGGLDRRSWDSDYCELGILEHARWKFLASAAAVINTDIDELLVSTSEFDAFEAARRSRSGVLCYRGLWMPGLEGRTRSPSEGAPLRHRDFDHHLRPERRWKYGVIPWLANVCATKWTVVPSRCPASAQWGTHRIKSWLPAWFTTSAFSYRHFREISTGWKYLRDEREPFSETRHARDDVLIRQFAKVRWDA